MLSVILKPQEQFLWVHFVAPHHSYLNKERQKNSCNLSQLHQLVCVPWQAGNKDSTMHFLKFLFCVRDNTRARAQVFCFTLLRKEDGRQLGNALSPAEKRWKSACVKRMANSECGSVFMENFLFLLQHLHKAQGTEGIDLSIAIWSPECQKSPVICDAKEAFERGMPQSLGIQSNEILVMHNNTSVQARGAWPAATLCVTDSLLLSPEGYPCTAPLWGDQKFPEQTAQAQMQEQVFTVILDHLFCWSRAQPQEPWYILSNGYCENFLMCTFVLKDFPRQLHNRKDFLVWFRQCLRLAGEK